MRRLLAAFALVLVTACGFKPVYSTGGGGFASGPIEVQQISGRSGHMLRRALQEQLAAGLPGIDQTAVLSVDLDENITYLAFKPDGAASRSSVIMSATYTLTDETRRLSGRRETSIDFSVPDAPYGDISAQTNATDRAARQIAQKIVDDLRLQLSAN